jgi:tetratricopeptide (TPR) repeat protein
MPAEPSNRAEQLTALALSLRRQGKYAAAKEAALDAVRAGQAHAAAWFNLASALAALEEWSAAEDAYRRALALQPHYAEAWSNFGGLLSTLGRAHEAVSAYRKGIAANERLAPIWSNLCNALCTVGEYAEAEQAGRTAVQLDPGFAPAWVNLGRALHGSKQYGEARDACRRAIELAPQLADAWAGLGNALMGVRGFGDAIDAYEKSIALQSDNAPFHANLGVALRRAGSSAAALRSLRRALELDPANAFASWNLANALLEKGELQSGWKHYESRWRCPEAQPRRFADKGAWPARGRLLIWGEQGVGDEILYAGMAAEIAAGGADVTLETDARLVPLFQRSFPRLTVCGRRDPPQLQAERFDVIVAAGALGQRLRSSWDDFPQHTGYLTADPARAARYRDSLQAAAPGSSLIVGIAWRSRNPELGVEKSAPLSQWRALLEVPGVTFVNLQYGAVESECEQAARSFGARIVLLPEPDLHDDLDGLAALQSACDLIISTSNVTAHLAGALGRHAWILLPQRIGRLWYWFHDRADSPWYPSVTLISQARDGEWASAIAAAARRLRTRVQGG